jgi:hypothetical protein
MEITKTKQRMEYNDDIKDLIKIFGFKDEKMGLKGSSSLSIMNYYADYGQNINGYQMTNLN